MPGGRSCARNDLSEGRSMKPSALVLLALLLTSPALLVLAAQTGSPREAADAIAPDVSKARDLNIRRVLALYWYPSDHPVTITFDRQFEEVLRRKSGNTVERYAEYFESTRFPGESQARIMRDY